MTLGPTSFMLTVNNGLKGRAGAHYVIEREGRAATNTCSTDSAGTARSSTPATSIATACPTSSSTSTATAPGTWYVLLSSEAKAGMNAPAAKLTAHRVLSHTHLGTGSHGLRRRSGRTFRSQQRAGTQLDEGGRARDCLPVPAGRVFPDRLAEATQGATCDTDSPPCDHFLYHIARASPAQRELRPRRLHPRQGASRAKVAARGVGPTARETGSAVKPWPWADTHPVARLVAPRRMRTCSCSPARPAARSHSGPGHLDGSALPGDPGNAVITAHRDTHFRFLRAWRPGDELVVERADGGRRHFRIRGGVRRRLSRACACRATPTCRR